MGEVVDQEEVGGGQDDGGDVADDDTAVEVVELWHGHVHGEGDEEENAGDTAAH